MSFESIKSKVFPLSGLVLSQKYSIDFCDLFPKKLLTDALGKEEANTVIQQFPDSETFAILPELGIQSYEVAYLRKCLAILFLANLDNKHGEWIHKTFCDIKIGKRNFDNDDFDCSISSFYTSSSDTPAWKKGEFRPVPLLIKENIQEKVDSLVNYYSQEKEAAVKGAMALEFLYYILPQTNLNSCILTMASILETLLLKNENFISKKISARSACLIEDMKSIDEKKNIATSVYLFYKMRCKIIHDGNSVHSLSGGDKIVFEKVRMIIFSLFYIFFKKNIETVDDIKKIVKKNIMKDGLKTGFHYINEI